MDNYTAEQKILIDSGYLWDKIITLEDTTPQQRVAVMDAVHVIQDLMIERGKKKGEKWADSF